MSFFGVLGLATALLRHRGRVSYSALRQEFDLDDSGLEALRSELIQVQQTAIDEGGTFLVWTGAESGSYTAQKAMPRLAAIGEAIGHSSAKLCRARRHGRSWVCGVYD